MHAYGKNICAPNCICNGIPDGIAQTHLTEPKLQDDERRRQPLRAEFTVRLFEPSGTLASAARHEDNLRPNLPAQGSFS